MSEPKNHMEISLSEDEERSFFTLLDLFPNTSPDIIIDALKSQSGNCDAAIDQLISISNNENEIVVGNKMEHNVYDQNQLDKSISKEVSEVQIFNPFEGEKKEQIINKEKNDLDTIKVNQYYENSFSVMEKEISLLRNQIDNLKKVIAFKDEVIQEKEKEIKELRNLAKKKDEDIKELKEQAEAKNNELILKIEEIQIFSNKLLEYNKKIETLEMSISQAAIENQVKVTNKVFKALESFHIDSKIKGLYEEFINHIRKELDKKS